MTVIKPLLDIMARLRDPNGGWPWDLEQNFATIAPYTIEEAYEVAEAIAQGNRMELRDELGDLLLQVVFHSQMAAEEGSFTFAEVVQSICDKMIRPHPHVFPDASIKDADAQTENWEKIKERERQGKQGTPAPEESPSITRTLANIPQALPALMHAQKLQSRAARVGFDWPDTTGVIAKIREELAEVEAAIASDDAAHIEEELGDVLFAVTNPMLAVVGVINLYSATSAARAALSDIYITADLLARARGHLRHGDRRHRLPALRAARVRRLRHRHRVAHLGLHPRQGHSRELTVDQHRQL